MRVQFSVRENGPERLEAEAEIVFDEGPVAGTKLVGFALWRGTDGELYVTLPSRAFGMGTERKFFDYLRGSEGTAEPVKRVKVWILDEYRNRPEATA